MAKMWDILQLFAELQVEAEPGPHTSHSAGELLESERRATGKLVQSSCMANMWDILKLLAELKVEAEPGPHTSHTAR
jgi:hypothetical protein